MLDVVVTRRSDGSRWRVLEASRTSDGFVLGTAQLLDENDEPAHDEDGFPVLHSGFLGAAQ